MPQRLTPLEATLLTLDTAHTPHHVGTVTVFDPRTAAGATGVLDHEHLLGLVGEQIAFSPRYRQRVRRVPGRLAAPVWVDDEKFDLAFHVRRTALPRPGTMGQLRELVARLLATRLDRSRPLWELHLVEGLEGGRSALVEKSHLALVDGIDTVDLGQVLLDPEPEPSAEGYAGPVSWHPALEPTPLELVGGALWESAQDPVRAAENLRGLVTGALGVVVAVGEVVGGVGDSLGDLAADTLRGGRRETGSPLAGSGSGRRRFATLRVSLADLSTVRTAHGCTVHDVVLALVAGGLRSWLLRRGETVTPATSLAALVPLSVPEKEGGASSLGSQVVPHLQDLPVGEPDALARLHEVARGTRAHLDSGHAVGARTLAGIAGFAPATLHALGARTAAQTVRSRHDILLTNAPGPQQPLYAAGAAMAQSYPVLPLAAGHLLSVGVTSYCGEVFFGLNADRDVGDLDVLVSCLEDALQELLATTGRTAVGVPTRRASPAGARAPATRSAGRQQGVGPAGGAPASRGKAGPQEHWPQEHGPQGPALEEDA